MELKDLSSKPLIIFLLVGISVAAIVLSVFASFQAKQAAMDAQAKTLARVIEVASDEVLEELFTKTKEVAHLIQKVKSVRQLIKVAKSTPLKPSQLNQLGEDLSLQFKQLYVTAGIIDLVKVRAYNKRFDYIVASHAGEKEFSDNLPTAIKEQISNREKGDRYKPFNTLWKNQEKTYYSLFYPVGGLSLSGYIEVVIAPSHNLKIIDNVLGAPLTIHSIDNTLLYQSKNWQAKSKNLLEIHYPLRFQNGEIALNLFLQEDVTEFLQSVKQTQLLIIGLFVLLGVVAVALAIFLLERNLFRPMKALQDSMSSVSEGDYSIEIKGSNRKDELGGMTNALLYFIFIFKENQRISTEASRIKFALQNAAAAMMIVNADEEIIFVNNSISQLFFQHQSDLSKLSSGSSDDLVGLVFYKHFDQLKELSLSEIKEPTYKEVRAGERYLKLVISPVNSENAERVGTTIEWQDLTGFYQKKAQEEERRIAEKNKLAREQKLFRENSRIRQALDGVERGVAIVDVHGNLAYNNRSMAKMIKPINNASLTIHHPFDLLSLANEEQLQKQIQQGFEEKEIKMGNQVFLVHATPVHDDSDQQIGSAIEWSDKTEEAEVETEIDNLIMKASQGELNKRISLENKRGFFRAVGKKLNDLVELINRSLTDTKLMMDSLAKGNLNHRIEANYQGTFGEIASSANQTAENLNDMIKNIQEMSSSVYTSSQEIAKGNMDLSNRTEKQGTILADTLTSMDSISENSIKCDEEAKAATVNIDQARSITDEAGIVSKRAVVAMNNITESSQKVMSITEMINDIAFQTNLLSLNAAVEAARAGEQGKGFAVVANEVRLLAQRSASASSEIKSLLDEANELVSNGTKEVSSSGEMLIGIADVTGQISGGMNAINDSTEQQRKGINNISHSVDEMKKMTQQNAAMVEEIAATSESMLEHAQGMQKAAGFFKLKK